MVARRRTQGGQFDFGRAVLGFSKTVYKKRDAVFQRAFIRLADEMQAVCPKDTQFLMSSLEASTAKTPRISKPNPRPNAPPGSFEWDRATFVGIVESAEFGEKLFMGYTAEYAGVVHDGHGNVESRPWVSLVTQHWREIVAREAKQVASERFER